MDKRFFLALFLSLIAIAVSQLLFPPSKPPAPNRAADSTSAMANTASSTSPVAAQPSTRQAPETTVSQARAAVATKQAPANAVAETTVVTTPKAIYKFSNIGAVPVSVVIRDYENRSGKGGLVELGVPGSS